MSEVRNRGKIFAITIYFVIIFTYIFFGAMSSSVGALNIIFFTLLSILGVLVLFVVMPYKEKSYLFTVFWAIFLIMQANASGLVFNDSRLALIIMLMQWVVAINFLSKKYLRFLFILQIVSIVAYNLLYTSIYSSRLENQSIVVEAFAVIIAFWISNGMVKNFTLVYDETDEHRMSLNEFLKLLKEKNEQAQSATRSKSAFLSNMSHEIRTPINSILGMNELILRESNEKDVLEKAGIIKSSSELLLSLVNDILDFSKIESGKMELVISEYDLPSLINDIYNIFNMRMKDKNLEFVIDVDEKLPAVLKGDSMRLRQVIINLMTNALKYTDKGKVTLRFFATDSEREGYANINVEVIDTGIGIAKEDLSKLNESFVRLNLERNNKVEGTGLGINIVNGFLKLMNTNLLVDSELGVGSKFYFTVEQEVINSEPIGYYNPSDIKLVQNNTGAAKPRYIAPDAKLLVVDDNEANIKVFVGLLGYMKMNIDTAFSGEAAIKLCDENKYDIVFMDHMMPGMDGKEAFHIIHSSSKLNKETPVYILTANAISGAKEEYLKEGFYGYLSKPIIPNKLETAIYETLDSSLLLEAGKEDIVPELKTTNSGWDASELPQIEGVDWEYAKLHFDNKELFIDILKVFVLGLPNSNKLLQGYYEALKLNKEDESLNDYRIQVHTNKSSANMCGIIPLAGLSATLEYAARDGRVDTVLDMTPHYLAECEKYYDKLNEAFGFAVMDGDEEIDAEEIKKILTEFISMAEMFDVDGMDKCMEELGRFHFEGELKENVVCLGQLVASLDTGSMPAVVDKILSGVV